MNMMLKRAIRHAFIILESGLQSFRVSIAARPSCSRFSFAKLLPRPHLGRFVRVLQRIVLGTLGLTSAAKVFLRI